MDRSMQFYLITNITLLICSSYILYLSSRAILLPQALLSLPVSAQCQGHSQTVTQVQRSLR